MAKFGTAVRQEFPDEAGDFDSIETEAQSWTERFGTAKRGVSRGFERAEGERCNNAEFLVCISLAGIATRLGGLIDGLTTLVNKRNAQAAPPVARALFETCCFPIYLDRELTPRIKKGRLNDVHRIVFRLGLGGTQSIGGGHIKPVPVDALLKSARTELKLLADSLPEDERFNAEELIEILYGPLTELTHPNWGALSLGTKLAMPPSFTYPAPFDETIVHFVASAAAYGLEAGGRAFDRLIDDLHAHPMDLPNDSPEWRNGEASFPDGV